jgi:hypothetical protein
VDGGDVDVAQEAEADASGCTQPLANYCGGSIKGVLGDMCDPDLATAIARVECATGFTTHRLAKGCGALDALYYTGTDIGSIEYFDSATGKLVAIADYSANFGGSEQCIGGPADFVVPSCPGLPRDITCPDAGDAGDGGRDDSGGIDSATDGADAPNG